MRSDYCAAKGIKMASSLLMHNRGLLVFQRGQITIELSTALTKLPVSTVGRWSIRYTEHECFVSSPMSLIEALEAADVYAQSHGYIFMRVEGLA